MNRAVPRLAAAFAAGQLAHNAKTFQPVEQAPKYRGLVEAASRSPTSTCPSSNDHCSDRLRSTSLCTCI